MLIYSDLVEEAERIFFFTKITILINSKGNKETLKVTLRFKLLEGTVKELVLVKTHSKDMFCGART
jgi:hypothetical protein